MKSWFCTTICLFGPVHCMSCLHVPGDDDAAFAWQARGKQASALSFGCGTGPARSQPTSDFTQHYTCLPCFLIRLFRLQQGERTVRGKALEPHTAAYGVGLRRWRPKLFIATECLAQHDTRFEACSCQTPWRSSATAVGRNRTAA